MPPDPPAPLSPAWSHSAEPLSLRLRRRAGEPVSQHRVAGVTGAAYDACGREDCANEPQMLPVAGHFRHRQYWPIDSNIAHARTGLTLAAAGQVEAEPTSSFVGKGSKLGDSKLER